MHSFAADTTGKKKRERKDCGAEGMGKEMMYNKCSYRWWGQRCGKGNDVQSVFIQMVGPKVSERKWCTVFIQMTGKGNAVVFIQMAGKGNDVQTMFMKIVGPKVSERKGCTNCVRTLRCVLFLFFL